MTEEEKLVRQAQGFDFVTEYKGKKICLNTKDFNKERFCKDWGFNKVEIFTEENGNKVLYDPTEYVVIINKYLHYRGESATPVQPIGGTFYGEMFSYKRLNSLDLSNWDVSKGTDFSKMFDHCGKLQSLNVENWDVSNITNFSKMFSNCWSLQSLNLENWDVSKGINFSYMFDCCNNLQSINLENWDVNTKAKIDYMFFGCGKFFPKYLVKDSDELAVKLFAKGNKEFKGMNLF